MRQTVVVIVLAISLAVVGCSGCATARPVPAPYLLAPPAQLESILTFYWHNAGGDVSLGRAFMVGDTIYTAYHLLQDRPGGTIEVMWGPYSCEAVRLDYHEDLDIARLRLKGPCFYDGFEVILPRLEFAERTPVSGEIIWYTGIIVHRTLPVTVTRLHAWYMGEAFGGTRYEADGPGRVGCSGGPALTWDGKVLGVMTLMGHDLPLQPDLEMRVNRALPQAPAVFFSPLYEAPEE